MKKFDDERRWSVPVSVHDIPEIGRRFELNADEHIRSAIAELAGLRELPRLGADFDVTRNGAGLRVAGRISADVGQVCVVTLEPMESKVDEQVDVVFVPDDGTTADSRDAVGNDLAADDAPEPMVGGTVDLGGIATEFLLLAIDPYPRKSEAMFDPPSGDNAATSPFAALAALKQGQRRNDR